ncbi:MAG: hypothetical protein ACPGIJ_09885, partial [Mycobacterium sp.]
ADGLFGALDARRLPSA